MLHVQKSVSNKTGLGFIENGSTTVVNENVVVDENPSDGELFESADL